MRVLDFEPSEGEKWNIEHAKGYYLQQIAIQLEQTNKLMKEFIKEADFWREINKRDFNKTRALDIALELMTAKNEVIEFFACAESMRLSEFRNRLSDIRIYVGNEAVDAISMTDYLETKKAGNGFRVCLVSGSIEGSGE